MINTLNTEESESKIEINIVDENVKQTKTADQQTDRKSKRISVNTQAVDSDMNLVYDLTYLEPHVWVKPILKSGMNSQSNSRCMSRNDGLKTPIEFSSNLHTIKEFKKERNNTNLLLDSCIQPVNPKMVQVYPFQEQAPDVQSLKVLECEGTLYFYPSSFKGVFFYSLVVFGVFLILINILSIYCLMKVGQNTLTMSLIGASVLSLVIGVVLLYHQNNNSPKAKSDYIYQFSNINGVQLSCRLYDQTDKNKQVEHNINDIKNCTIMNVPQGQFIREEEQDEDSDNQNIINLGRNQQLDSHNVECIVVETQDNRHQALSEQDPKVYEARKMYCSLNDQVEKWKRLSQ